MKPAAMGWRMRASVPGGRQRLDAILRNMGRKRTGKALDYGACDLGRAVVGTRDEVEVAASASGG